MHASLYGRGVSLQPIVDSPRYDAQDYTDVPYLDTAVVYNEAEEEVTIFAVNRNLNEALDLECDVRSFEGYRLVEHIVMEHEDLKAVNTAAEEKVKPHSGGGASLRDGYLTGRLAKASWNVMRLKKA
ncbi:Intracellular exo-alpha-(1-_5)-L-arabinofuranosidase [compost metagenome]